MAKKKKAPKPKCPECGLKLNGQHSQQICEIVCEAHKLVGQAFEGGTLQGSYSQVSPAADRSNKHKTPGYILRYLERDLAWRTRNFG